MRDIKNLKFSQNRIKQQNGRSVAKVRAKLIINF